MLCFVQVICWRAAASIAWAVLLLPPITAVFIILSRFSLLHPIQTISGQSLGSNCKLSFVTHRNCDTQCILLFTHRMPLPLNKRKCRLLINPAVFSGCHGWVPELGVLHR